jgi:LacI family transcriptional regulator
MTVGAILALHELHLRIPEDISFIGFDHFEAIDVVEPPLTVIEQPIERIGQLAAELVLKRIQGDYADFPTTVKLNTKMVIRNSVQKL